jgi:hypothetical protein
LRYAIDYLEYVLLLRPLLYPDKNADMRGIVMTIYMQKSAKVAEICI